MQPVDRRPFARHLSGAASTRAARITAAATLVVAGAVASWPTPAGAVDGSPTPGTRPASRSSSAQQVVPDDPGGEVQDGLQLVVNERGHYSRAIAAVGDTGDLVLDKPAGATVHKAYLAMASQGYTSTRLTAGPTLAGQPVALDLETPSQIASYNYFTDVTDIVADDIDAGDGPTVTLPLVENDPYQEASELVVIYDDPAVTSPRSVTMLFGALNPFGDTYGVNLTEPVDLSDPDTHMDMSLGIDFSFQDGGTQQYSTVDVNGQRLTSSAGGSDDGYPFNGALVTAGGYGDSIDNPVDPNAGPTDARSDDELYDLLPFVHDGDRKLTVQTTNPSDDDNVFLAVLTMNPPVRSVATDGDTMDVTPETRIGHLGLTVGFEAHPDRTIDPSTGGFGTPYRAMVLSGANVGRDVAIDCAPGGGALPCDFSGDFTTDRLTITPAPDYVIGDDRIRIWLDTDKDGVQDDAEQFATVTVHWTEAVHAVAMGDSYSSGEGVDPYDSGTDDDWGDNRNQCHRSKYAYGRLTIPAGYETPLPDYVGGTSDTTVDLIACSGATTENVRVGGTEQQPGEGASQIDQGTLGPDTDFVTLSIGGNDLGFSPVLTACLRKHCGDPDAGGANIHGVDVHTYLDQRIAQYRTDLANVLAEIKDAAPAATVVLVGYPHLFPASMDVGGSCQKLEHVMFGDTQSWMNGVGDSIDSLETQVAAEAGVNYLSPSSSFSGHEICGQRGEWLSGITAPNPFDLFHKSWVGTGSFHPNQEGQQAYADMINRWLSDSYAVGAPFNQGGLPRNPDPTQSLAPRALDAAQADAPPADSGELEITAVPDRSATSCYPDGIVGSGQPTRLWGTGFAPGSLVTITWENPDSTDAATTVASATASSAGQLATVITVPAAEGDSYGLLRADGSTPGGNQLELLGSAGVATGTCDGPTFDFTGFFAPVDNLPTVNVSKAGSAIPVKFSLGGDQGLGVLAGGSPTSGKVACDTGAPLDEIEQTVAPGASGLTYDPGTDRYQYVWKTDKAWAGTCRQLVVTLSDGSSHTAAFRFR